MKKYIAGFLVLGLVGCSSSDDLIASATGNNGVDGKDGSSCSVFDYVIDDTLLGAQILCTDNTYSIILNGSNGSDGDSCTVNKEKGVSTISCGDSSVEVVDGKNGEVGSPGKNGSDGQSCYQNGSKEQSITYRDYTELPEFQSAFCSRRGSFSRSASGGNCDQHNCNSRNQCTNEWKYNPPVLISPGLYEDRTVTISIPKFSCGE